MPACTSMMKPSFSLCAYVIGAVVSLTFLSASMKSTIRPSARSRQAGLLQSSLLTMSMPSIVYS